jgi:centromeric protein E
MISEEGNGAINGSFLTVATRIKPEGKFVNGKEDSEEGNSMPLWHIDENTVTHILPGGIAGSSFSLDNVFVQENGNALIYQNLGKQLVEYAIIKGVNATIFAYGQTSTGKTWTMLGNEEDPGIIPLALKDLFSKISSHEGSESGVIYSVKASYLEIYNEIIYDLLDRANSNLKVHETPERGVFVGKLSEWAVTDSLEALNLLKRGEENRKIGCTNMNERSSRSHTIFQLTISSKPRDCHKGGKFRKAVLTFVDLAGSERVGQTGAEGLRLKEGGHINKSLLALTSVVSKLSENSLINSGEFIPYRDSKLTRILQPSLGGNSATTVLCCVSPNPEYFDETLSTLKFAIRAKSIKNIPVSNEAVIPEPKVFKLQKENQLLVKRINDLQEDNERTKRAKVFSLKSTLEDCQTKLVSAVSSLKELFLIANHLFADTSTCHGDLLKKILSFSTVLKENQNFVAMENKVLKEASTSADVLLQEKQELLAKLAEKDSEIENLTKQSKESVDLTEVFKGLITRFSR